jgi:DNA-binding response OmpR family regulator
MDNLALLLENSHPSVSLTPTELQLLRALNDGEQSRADLLVKAWAFSPSLASKVSYKDTRMLDMTTSRLRKKVAGLGIQILSLRGKGYRLQ